MVENGVVRPPVSSTTIYQTCDLCAGVGTVGGSDQGEPQDVTCPKCEGNGEVRWGRIVTE